MTAITIDGTHGGRVFDGVGAISGGGSRSDLWTAIAASMLGIALERTACDAGSAFGAALLAGVREGVFADEAEAVARCVRVTDRTEPVPDWAETYTENYARYRALYPARRPLEVA